MSNNLKKPTTRKANLNNKHMVNRMYGRFYGFALDKQVDRTRNLNKSIMTQGENIELARAKVLNG
jgi:hypothetical protein